MKKIIVLLFSLLCVSVQAQTFNVGNLSASGYITAVGNITGTQFIGNLSGNLIGGGAGQLLCQTATNTTGYIAAGTNGYYLQAQTSGCPIWVAGSAYTPGSVAITGGSINGTTIGITTPSSANFTSVGATTQGTGSFTDLASSGTVSGTGFSNYLSNYLASPSAIGGTTPAAGSFTNLLSSGLATFSTALINPVTPSKTELQIGAGSTTAAGFYLGNLSSGNGAIWSTGVTPSISNYSIAANSNGTTINAENLTAIAVGNSVIISATSDTASIKGTTAGGNAAAGKVGEVISVSASSISLTTTASNILTLPLTAGDWDVYASIQSNNTGTLAGISTVSGTLPVDSYNLSLFLGSITAGPVPTQQINIIVSKNVYLVANATNSTTCAAIIWARRAR